MSGAASAGSGRGLGRAVDGSENADAQDRPSAGPGGFVGALRRVAVAQDTMLCVGLDPEPDRFPAPWTGQPRHIFDFCAAIVEATHDLVLAFKPQFAHFAAHRAEDQLEQLIRHIRTVAPQVPVILDAKRGDIGSTAQQYAREAFERYGADAVTLSPFLGFDSIEPYLAYRDRGAILLCRTSNPGGDDLQALQLSDGERLYERIARLAEGSWNRHGQLSLVVGATYPEELARVRAIAPSLPLLIPGIGAQGGDAEATVRAGYGTTASPLPLLMISSSRAILYAGDGPDFAQAARRVAEATRRRLNEARPR